MKRFIKTALVLLAVTLPTIYAVHNPRQLHPRLPDLPAPLEPHRRPEYPMALNVPENIPLPKAISAVTLLFQRMRRETSTLQKR
jgi:hypothetical protein